MQRGQAGQRADDSIGLMYYNARWYDPTLGRFTQADTIIPGAGNPLAWDRYAYVNNNPIRLIDSSGHIPGTIPTPNNHDDGGGYYRNRDIERRYAISRFECMPCLPSDCYNGPSYNNLVSQLSTAAENTYTELSDYIESVENMDDFFSPLINGSEYLSTLDIFGRPIYRVVKGVVPTSLIELALSSIFQLNHDSPRTDLSAGQRGMRAVTVGMEDFFTDILSSGIATATGVAGAGSGGLAASFLGPEFFGAGAFLGGLVGYAVPSMTTSWIMDDIWSQFNTIAFPLLGFGEW